MMPAVIAAGKSIDGRMNFPVFAVELSRAGLAPALQNDLDRLQQHFMADGTIDAEHDLVTYGGAGAQSKIDPTPRHVIELSKLCRNGQRMVLVEHADAGAEPDPAGLSDCARDHLEGTGDR